MKRNSSIVLSLFLIGDFGCYKISESYPTPKSGIYNTYEPHCRIFKKIRKKVDKIFLLLYTIHISNGEETE